MLENTIEAFGKVKKDFDFLSWCFTYGINIVMIIYLAISISLSMGNFLVNISSISLTTLGLIFTIVFKSKRKTKKANKIAKQKLKKTKRVLNIAKLLVQTYSLGLTIYGMYIATTHVSPVSIIITTLLIVMWIIKAIIEIIKFLFIFEKDRLLNGIKKDFAVIKQFPQNQVEHVKEVATNVKNFFEKGKNKKQINK